jgi:hypothetical protein
MARRRLRGPGLAMVLAALWMFLTSAITIYFNFFSDRDWSLDLWNTLRTLSDHPAYQDWVQSNIANHPNRDRTVEKVVVGLVPMIRGIVYSVVLIAGLRMIAVKNYGFCITGAILSVIFNGAFCAGLPVGIWALWMLCQPQLRQEFDRPVL